MKSWNWGVWYRLVRDHGLIMMAISVYLVYLAWVIS